MFPQPYNFLYTESPQLATIDSQLMFAPPANPNPNESNSLDKALSDAEATLASTDKTNVNQYIGIMQQVLMLRQRKAALTSSTTRESLLAQKVTILEGLLNPTPSQ
jgi:hypothetical protein